jgi:hypothetical protein
VRLPALLLVAVYLAAVAVALRDPSEHLLAGLVVLSAVVWRLPAARSAISHVVVRHPVRDRRVRRAAAAPAVAPATPV